MINKNKWCVLTGRWISTNQKDKSFNKPVQRLSGLKWSMQGIILNWMPFSQNAAEGIQASDVAEVQVTF